MRDFAAFVKNHLKSNCPSQEMNQIARLLLEKIAGMDKMQFYGGKDIKIPENTAIKLREAVIRIANHEPLQYILGETEFSGLTFHVRPGVLIPRPETEEMVEMIIKYAKTELYRQEYKRIADICTGSGCIAVALSKWIPGSIVEAWEISPEALTIAKENAEINKTEVMFRQLDVLHYNAPEEMYESFDIMVSNPPYVCRNEQKDMETKILENEPHLALFVENNNPLLFYEVIASIGLKILKKGGYLYFEINNLMWKETLDLLNSFSFSNVAVFKDISGHERFIRVQK